MTYFLKDSLLTAKEKRQQAEKKMIEDEKYPKYPSWEQVEKENQEAKPAVYFEIRDAAGNFVNRIAGKTNKGLHRVTWDMTYAKASAITDEAPSPWHPFGNGLMAAPGKYSATMFKRVGSEITKLAEPVEFELKPITKGALAGSNPSKAFKFAEQVANAERRSSAVDEVIASIENTMKSIRTALDKTSGDTATLEKQYADIQAEINAINLAMYGLESRAQMGISPANISSRLGYAMTVTWSSTYGPTKQHIDQLGYALEGLDKVTKQITELQQQAIPSLQKEIIDAGGPWTIGAPVIAN